MKRLISSTLLATGLAFGATAAQSGLMFIANMTHDQEVDAGGNPIVPDEGSSAVARFALNDAKDRLTYDILIVGLDLGKITVLPNPDPNNGLTPPIPPQPVPVAERDDFYRLHIHRAKVGLNGGIVFGMIDNSPALRDDANDLLIDVAGLHITGAWDLNEGANGATLGTELNNLLAGGLYINIHTADHGSGEIRGQIVQVPAPGTLALLGIGGLGMLGLRRRRNV